MTFISTPIITASLAPVGLAPDVATTTAAIVLGTTPVVDTYVAIGPPALARGDGGGDDDEGSFLGLRDYQCAQIQSVVASVRSGDDRGIMRAPMQTGKSMLIGHLARMALKKLFSGKDILVVSPFRIITEQILDDLKRTMPGVDVGVVDAGHKDFNGGHRVIVASAFTLGRDKNLEKIDPNRFGLVIVDEATFTMASTWQKILKKFGFLDEAGNILHADGKYLLGLTADPYSLQGIFGTGAKIHSLGFRWFMEHGYLHHIRGLQVSYSADVKSGVREDPNEGLLFEPKSSAMQSTAVVETYETYFPGKKVMVFTSSIEHAKSHEAIFNERFGDGHAVAVYANMSPQSFKEATDAIERGKAKVIISIGMLAYGYRARGVEGIIHDHQTISARRFGSRIGRPLSVRGGEEQRTVLNIDLIGHGAESKKFVTLASFFGLADRVQTGIEYDPLTIKNPSGRRTGKGGPKRVFVPRVVPKHGILFGFSEKPSEYEFQEGRLQGHLKSALEIKFGRDITTMADALSLDTEKLYRFLYGELPRTEAEVRNIARGIGMRDGKLVELWEVDALDAMEYMYPTSHHGDVTRDLIMFARLATIRVGGVSSTHSALVSIGEGRDYISWQLLLSGKIKNGHASLPAIRRVFTAAEKRTGISMEKVENAITAFEEDLEGEKILEISYGTAGDVLRAGARFFNDVDVDDPHENAERHEMVRVIRSLLVMLRPHEEVIFRLFLGIGYDRAYSIKEIAEKFEVVPSYISQVMTKAVRRLLARLDNWQEGRFPEASKPNAYLEWREGKVARIAYDVQSLRRLGRYFGATLHREMEMLLKNEFQNLPS